MVEKRYFERNSHVKPKCTYNVKNKNRFCKHILVAFCRYSTYAGLEAMATGHKPETGRNPSSQTTMERPNKEGTPPLIAPINAGEA